MTGYLPGDHVVHVDEDMRITAQKGDVIGWYNEGPPIVPFTSRHDRNMVVPTKSRVGNCCTTNAAVCTARVSGDVKHRLARAYPLIHSG